MRYYTKYGFIGWFFTAFVFSTVVFSVAAIFVTITDNTCARIAMIVVPAIPLACFFYYHNRWTKYIDLLPGKIEITYFPKEKKDKLSITHSDIEYVEYFRDYYGLKNSKFKVDYLIHLYATKKITQLTSDTIPFDRFTAYCEEHRIPLRELKLDD